jgi:DNA-binding transcriptional MerR regulator
MRTEVNKDSLKIPAKLYRIGELVAYTPFSRQTIHNYTIMGLIHEAQWTEGGHRLYDESVFERLSEIIRLRRTKTLSEIRVILNRKEKFTSQTERVAMEEAN